MGLGRTHAHSQPPLFAVYSHLPGGPVPADHLQPIQARLTVISTPFYALFHLRRTDGDTLLQVRGGGRGSQVNQKGVDGWMLLQGSLLMHSARLSLPHAYLSCSA